MFVTNKEESKISLCGEYGLSACRAFEREVESGMSRCEFRQTDEKSIREISEMSGMKMLYNQELMKRFGEVYNGFSAHVKCRNDKISDLLRSCFYHLGMNEKPEMLFNISYSGKEIYAETEKGIIGYDKLLAVCCYDEMRKGRDVAVPYDAPLYLDSVAEKLGRKVLRYLKTPADNSDASARRLASKQVFVRDALFMCAKLVSVMNERCMTLDSLTSEIPEKYIEKKIFNVNFPVSSLSSVIGGNNKEDNLLCEGIRLLKDEGSLLVIPEKGGERIKVFAEADTMEAADELCSDIEEIVNSLSN